MKESGNSLTNAFRTLARVASVFLMFCMVAGCGPAGRDLVSGREERRTAEKRERAVEKGEAWRDSGKKQHKEPDFKTDFVDETLRVDLFHKGVADPGTERYVVDEMVNERMSWPGSRTVLFDPDDFGAHRFEVRDRESGKLIFAHGFGSLFSEWRTTDEAKKRMRTFSESVRFPRPKRPFLLDIQSRGRDNVMRTVSSFALDPADARKAVDPGGGEVRPLRLHGEREPHMALDVLIIADGYTEAEREKATMDGRRFADVLLNDRVFAEHREEINIWLLAPPSRDSGVTEPRKGIELDTPVGLSFNTLNSPRYMMTLENKKMRAWAALAPYDQLYLMSNTSRYGGGGIYNLYSTFPADNEYSEYVFIHEFGHSFGGLGDEYYGSPVATSDYYPEGVEPWEPNLTRFLEGRFKWSDMVSKDTPVPTPPDDERFSNRVGLFEGAGYIGKGMYRPALDCTMFSKAFQDFCPVCTRAMRRRLTRYTR